MKLIASDYDGTLNRNRIVCQEDIQAVTAWRKAGNLFGLVTGRGFSSARREMQHYGVEVDFYICNNGSAIFDETETPIYCAQGNPAVLKPLVQAIIDVNGTRAAISCGKERYCVILDAKRDCGPQENWISFSALDTFKTPFTQLDTNAQTDENAAKLVSFINQHYGTYVHAHQNGINVDITPVGCNKPKGIFQYIQAKGIAKEDVLVIGDNTNDLEMIQTFHGYVISSGNPAVIPYGKKAYDSVGDFIYDIL